MRTRSQFAYDAILSRLKEGQLRAGDRLIETSLCAELGLSRIPLREAIRQLATEGLVSHVAGLGATVRCPTHREIIELYEVRQLLEGHAVAQAAKRIGQREIDELQSYCDRMYAVIRHSVKVRVWGSDEQEEMFSADVAFHQTISRVADNTTIVGMIQGYQMLWKMVSFDPRLPQSSTWHSRSWAWGHHMRILRALKKRDSDEARRAMVHHLSLSCQIALTGHHSLERLLADSQ